MLKLKYTHHRPNKKKIISQKCVTGIICILPAVSTFAFATLFEKRSFKLIDTVAYRNKQL